ncbi:hypothetical protein A2J03_03160 [Rhodococcus sp. EPR-157]|nr:hypothetical protein A2J03_03160 [Rhodococcus sp. EPR-157]
MIVYRTQSGVGIGPGDQRDGVDDLWFDDRNSTEVASGCFRADEKLSGGVECVKLECFLCKPERDAGPRGTCVALIS